MLDTPPSLCAIVIPVYNKSTTVARAIDSVKYQTLNNLECVLVDDGSTDGSREVILRAIDGDARFRYVYQENQRVAAARNRGVLRETTAPFICTLDADDAIAPTFLETCVRALRADNSLGIAYTGLWYIKPDGEEGLSAWPGEFSADAQIAGQNQIPTCNVARRAVWERTGGQRSRYCQNGAGEEDAEMWLRAISLGWNAKKVTDEGLFLYSYLSGSVSGNQEHKASDWLADKPYVYDDQYPFASLVTPANGLSHLVRQYDRPEVSIVIPVGPGHAQYLADALDSIDAQSFRLWEVIVVDNTLNNTERMAIQELVQAYPFARVVVTHVAGAGRARNFGVSAARAPLILPLDCDDWLSPNALEVMVNAYKQHPGEIIYSDYWGYAYISDERELARLQRADRLAHHDPETKRTVIRYFASEYDCEEALRQPDPGGKLYIWNVVSSLVPRQHFLDVGGFDEEMESWEDWDLWLRMAQQGHCFTRVAEPLLHYRFYSGHRRALANPGESGDDGRQLSSKLLEYMTEKYKRSENMPGCRSCGGGKRTTRPPAAPMMASLNEGRVATMSAGDLVEVELMDGNIGEHLIAFSQVSYGYRKHGERFKMQEAHAKLDRRVRIIPASEQAAAQPIQVPKAQQKPLPPPPGSDEGDEVSSFNISNHDNLSLAVTNPDAKLVVPNSGSGAIGTTAPAVALEVKQAPAEGKEEKKIVITSNAYKFQDLWGIDEQREKVLLDAGIRSLRGLLATKPQRLAELLDVPETMAKNILSRAESAK